MNKCVSYSKIRIFSHFWNLQSWKSLVIAGGVAPLKKHNFKNNVAVLFECRNLLTSCLSNNVISFPESINMQSS